MEIYTVLTLLTDDELVTLRSRALEVAEELSDESPTDDLYEVARLCLEQLAMRGGSV